MAEDTDRPPVKGAKGIEKVVDLVDIAGSLRPLTAAMAGGERVEDLLLVESARDHGILDRIVLIGRKERIVASVAKVGIDVAPEDIVAAEREDEAAAATVELVKSGAVEMVLKGSVATNVLNRHMLPLATRATVSLVSIFDAAPIAQGRPMILTDAGITTVCNFGRIAGLIRNAVDVARSVMRIERPRVAVLSATEKPIATLASTQLGAEFARRGWPDADVYGPLSLDLATDPKAVAVKGLPDVPGAREVGGQADILVCPNIESGNVIYKMISAMIKYGQASLANIIMGFPMPYVLLSRSDALETRLNSVALGAIYAQWGLGEQPPRPAATVSVDSKRYRVLAVNPGSTSTKIAVYEGETCVHHVEAEYAPPPTNTAPERRGQVEELLRRVRAVLDQGGWRPVDAVSVRGGFLPRTGRKLPGGTYVIAERRDGNIVVDEVLVNAILENPEKEHASNLGVPVGAALAAELKAPAFVVDPVVTDEYAPEAELSGYAPITRRSISHALSVRAAARKAAKAIGRPLEDITMIVAHFGGGATVAPVCHGRMMDNNISLLGGGPFTSQRAGQLPAAELIDLCYSGRFSQAELIEELTKRGGLQSYLGEHRLDAIEKRIAAGDDRARLVVDAMVYQMAKEIGAMFVAAGCDAEAIVLTGGMIRSERVRNELRRRVGRLAPVLLFEESLEMEALAAGAIRVLTGAERGRRYEDTGVDSE
ncbi:MAG TPA: butyrate kinase [Candidatus Hydrogenedentes bacterium]|nr:butyrate kinase [Candidatus Hydrogenedentota bacterium]HPG65553.1 butyrate kinase [Candidatus Hydrogenedentota bacterium]